MKVVFVFGLLLLLSFDWSKSDKENFLRECTKNASRELGEKGAKEYCSCMLEKMILKYPNSLDATKITIEQATNMAKTCIPAR